VSSESSVTLSPDWCEVCLQKREDTVWCEVCQAVICRDCLKKPIARAFAAVRKLLQAKGW
jgi:hypothetical protein